MIDTERQKSASKVAMEAYIVALCKTEVQLFRDREYWKSEEPLTAYFQSTPHKAAFGRLMTKAALVAECYNIKEISETLNLTRQSVHRMVNDCMDAGWIEVCIRCCSNGEKDKYIASQELVKSTDGYASYLIKTLIKTGALDSEILVASLIKHNLL